MVNNNFSGALHHFVNVELINYVLFVSSSVKLFLELQNIGTLTPLTPQQVRLQQFYIRNNAGDPKVNFLLF